MQQKVQKAEDGKPMRKNELSGPCHVDTWSGYHILPHRFPVLCFLHFLLHKDLKFFPLPVALLLVLSRSITLSVEKKLSHINYYRQICKILLFFDIFFLILTFFFYRKTVFLIIRKNGKAFISNSFSVSVMREMGLEPTRPFDHQILSLACLPIPALPLLIYRPYQATNRSISVISCFVNIFLKKTLFFSDNIIYYRFLQ